MKVEFTITDDTPDNLTVKNRIHFGTTFNEHGDAERSFLSYEHDCMTWTDLMQQVWNVVEKHYGYPLDKRKFFEYNPKDSLNSAE